MRVLGRVRLSRATEESTSVERQRELIEAWVKANDHEIVGWAEDIDVSGSVDPFDTSGLGPWLTAERRDEWDILAVWKLDRLGRDAIRLNALFGWALDNGKTITSCTEGIDLSTPVGRLIANVIAFLAEGEREAIRERTAASQKKLRESGRWGGGKIFYGYKAAERDDAGWELVPDEHAAEVLAGIIEKVLAGQSTESIARELNESEELSPLDYQLHRAGKPTKGRRWSNAHLRQQLRSKSLLGHMTHGGSTVRDDSGMPVLKGPPLIDQDTFDRLQSVLDARSFKVSNRSTNASPLLGVAFCGWCGKPMHIRQHRRGDKVYRYYQCTGGADGSVKSHADVNIVKADELEDECESLFLGVYGGENVKEKVFIPAEDHQRQLDEAVRAAGEITPLLGAAASDTMRRLYLSQLEALDRRISELEKLPVSSARWEWREQPDTYADVWVKSDVEERRQLLMKRKVRVEASASKGEGRYRGPAEVRLFALDMDPEEFESWEARAAVERAKAGL
jgi:site-specific DNA recombinase